MKFAQEAGANVVSSTHIAFHQLGHAFNFVVFNQVSQWILIIWWNIVGRWSMSWGHEDDLNHTGYPLEQRFVLFISGHWWFLMRPQFRARRMSCRCLKLLKLGFNNQHIIHYFVAPMLSCCQRVRNRYRYWLIWTLLIPRSYFYSPKISSA